MPGFDTDCECERNHSYVVQRIKRHCPEGVGRRRDVKVIIYDDINLLQYEFSDNKVEYCKCYG
jgi:hypothetical protein